MTEPKTASDASTPDPNSTANGRVMDETWNPAAEPSSFVPRLVSPTDDGPGNSALARPPSLRAAALRRRIATAYVSRKNTSASPSHSVASARLAHSTARQPPSIGIPSAAAPPNAGPKVPPSSVANMKTLRARPRCSGGNTSPTMGGYSTLDETAAPVRARAATSAPVLRERAASSVARMKSALVPCRRGARPRASERGAMSSGPAASPSSHIVTRRTPADWEGVSSLSPSRSLTMRLATGTTEMQVKVLDVDTLGSATTARPTGQQRVCPRRTICGEADLHRKRHEGQEHHHGPFIRLGPLRGIVRAAVRLETGSVRFALVEAIVALSLFTSQRGCFQSHARRIRV